MLRRSIVALLVAVVVAASPAASAPAETPKRGGTVVIAGPVPTCLNFLSCTGVMAGLREQVLEGAFEVAPDLTYRPNLVSGVDIVSREPLTLDYHIRPEARWSDATPVTASDFVFTFQAFLAAADENDPLRKIRRVAARGAKTLRVSFRSRYAGWRELFHVVLPRHALAGEDLKSIWLDTIDNPKTGEPIGSGPFLVERLERGRQLILARNPRYWGPHSAYLDRIVFRTVQGDIVEAVRSGQVDVVFPFTEREALDLMQQGIRVLTSPGLSLEHFAIRLGAKGHPALKKRLVRRALAYGVDREALVRRQLRNINPVLDSAVFPTQSRFYRPHWKVFRYRPAEARRLLEQAGCRRGADGIYACRGERLSLRFRTTGGSPFRELGLRLVQAQLRKVGVEVVPGYAPPGTLFGTILQAGDFDLALFSWSGGADPAGSVEIYRCGGAQNFTGYCNRQVSRDLLRSDLLLDEQARAALLNRVDEQLARDVPVIPLFQIPWPVAFRATLRNVKPSDLPDFLTWNSEDWWLER